MGACKLWAVSQSGTCGLWTVEEGKKGKVDKKVQEAREVLKDRRGQHRFRKGRQTGRECVAGGRFGEGRVFRPAHGKSGLSS